MRIAIFHCKNGILPTICLHLPKKGISSVELAKILNITQASSWYMLHRIRETLRRNQISQQLFGIIEVDETYVNPGHRIEKKRGRGTSKVAVFGLVERKGNISITPVENTKRKTLDPIIRRKVIPGSRIMSDEWSAYNKLRDGYIHEVVKQQIIVYYFCFFRTWVLCR